MIKQMNGRTNVQLNEQKKEDLRNLGERQRHAKKAVTKLTLHIVYTGSFFQFIWGQIIVLI